MNKMKVVKHYNQHMHEIKLGELNKELVIYKQMLQLIREIEPDADSVVQLEFKLNNKTNFLNPEMSAEAFNKGAEFRHIKQLEAKCTNINSDDLTNRLEFKQTFLNNLKEQYTQYYEPKELEQRQKLQEIMDDFNKLDISTRHLCNFNYNKELHYHIFANVNLG